MQALGDDCQRTPVKLKDNESLLTHLVPTEQKLSDMEHCTDHGLEGSVMAVPNAAKVEMAVLAVMAVTTLAVVRDHDFVYQSPLVRCGEDNEMSLVLQVAVTPMKTVGELHRCYLMHLLERILVASEGLSFVMDRETHSLRRSALCIWAAAREAGVVRWYPAAMEKR